MDNDNPWCPITNDFYGKLGDMQCKYGEGDWPESAIKEYAALDDGLREHIRNCAQCSIEEAFSNALLRGPIHSC